MSKRYILLKHLPDVNAGTEFQVNHDGTLYFILLDHTGCKINSYCYTKEFVESHPEWFKEKQSDIYEEKWSDYALDIAMMNAFYAAREMVPVPHPSGLMDSERKYQTFNDYKDSLKKLKGSTFSDKK